MKKGFMEKVLGRPQTETFTVLLAHSPMFFREYAEWGADLTLAGHFHGGTIQIPFLGGLMTPQMTEMMSRNDLDIPSLCCDKTVLYVKCSDVDRSKDKLVEIFFMQLFQELYRLADCDPSHTLPRPMHILLDDVGANLRIPNMDGIIATARGRGISLSLVLQSIGQLKRQYTDYTSILNSCNTVVFLGGSDIETCREMAERLDRPLADVLYKAPQVIYVFRQGSKPIITEVYDLKSHPDYPSIHECRCATGAQPKEEMYL